MEPIIQDILYITFGYLSNTNLKSIKSVCKEWYFISSKILQRRTTFFLLKNKIPIKNYKLYTTTMKNLQFLNSNNIYLFDYLEVINYRLYTKIVLLELLVAEIKMIYVTKNLNKLIDQLIMIKN